MDQNSCHRTVCVVDDDRVTLLMTRRLLLNHGYQVMAYSSPLEFLEHGSSEEYGCIILDMDMPEMSGLDVLKRLHRARPATSILFLTSSVDESVKLQALRNGATGFLNKMGPGSALLEAVREAVERKIAPREEESEAVPADEIVAAKLRQRIVNH